MTRRLPYGAELDGDGKTSFRIWAPNAEGMELVLGEDRRVPMEKSAEGFFEAVVEDAPAGTSYAFKIGDQTVPDPASRLQETDVHGRSVVHDPNAFDWTATDWKTPPWEEAVIYECHVGTFTEEGSYRAIEDKLDHLRKLGVNTIELMPVAQFSGERGWGYDGVLPNAPHNAYGSPDDLRHLIDTCHRQGIAVMIDVVYNHFGPDGNYLHLYASDFFDEEQHTPWGAALDFSKQPVRDFFIQNAIQWLTEYRFDGIRFDAVHAINGDVGKLPFLEELSRTIRQDVGRDRYLVLENDDNAAGLIGPDRAYTAQWNDDIHHVLHRIATGETDGYYGDYEDRPTERLVRCLTEGFDYQGEPSQHRGGASRGEPSADRPPKSFVAFIQNHDQVGNRAEGERIFEASHEDAVRAVSTIYLLSPQIPMLWMGEEWAATSRFPFFCDFQGELADAVREGRRREFAQFKRFADPEARKAIPDPNDPDTFAAAKLDWTERTGAKHAKRLAFFRKALKVRASVVVPLVRSGFENASGHADGAFFTAEWHFVGGTLRIEGHLGDETGARDPFPEAGRIFGVGLEGERPEPWSVGVFTTS